MKKENEMKHTPGPWTAELANADQPSFRKFWHVVSETALPPFRPSVVQLVWECGILPSDEANARLIAAAPDLLEACKLAMKIEPRDATEKEPWATIVAAIAKAEGNCTPNAPT